MSYKDCRACRANLEHAQQRGEKCGYQLCDACFEKEGPPHMTATTQASDNTRMYVAIVKLCRALGVPADADVPDHVLLERLAEAASPNSCLAYAWEQGWGERKTQALRAQAGLPTTSGRELNPYKAGR